MKKGDNGPPANKGPEMPKKSPTRLEVIRRREAFEALMAECLACQSAVPPHWQFCAHCGVRLAAKCPGCGEPLPPKGANFCPHCGIRIPALEMPS